MLQQLQAFPTGTHITTPGGWLDAGDLNTYIGTTPWAAYLLLITYEDHKTYWDKLDANSNGIPDILDQTRTALDWMLTMRGKDSSGAYDGSCYERVWKDFSGALTDGVVGNADDRPVDTDKWTDLCIRVAQAGAVAYRVWNAYDSTAASAYRTMAEQAYAWSSNPANADKPKFALGGGIYWSDLASNRALAATELYKTSCLSSCVGSYLTDATNLIDAQAPGGTWTDTTQFPDFFPSTWRSSGTMALQRFYDYGYGSAQLRADIVTAIRAAYDTLITNANAGPYKVWRGAFSSFGPSSIFGALANDAVWLYKRTGVSSYYDFALNQQGWLWGRNNVNTSFWATSRATAPPLGGWSFLTNNKSIEHFILPGAYDRCGSNGIPDFGSSAQCPSFSITNHQYGEPTINSAALNLRAMTELHFAKIPAGDVTAPLAPTGLTASADATSIALDWSDNTQTDLLGYNVHRSTVSGFAPSTGNLLRADVTNSSWVDASPVPGTTYYYKVVAIDTSDNPSPASSQASAVISTGSTLLSDDFQDGNSTGWSTTSGTWSVVTDGSLVFKQSATGTSGKANAGTASWTNYTVQARVKANELPSGTASGIVARYTDDNNLYWLRLHAAGNVELYKAVGGTFTLIHSVPQPVVVNTWYTLKLALNGSTLSAYVDGIQKFSVTDTAHTTGKTGARSYQQAFSIDDVLVTTIPTTLLSDDFQDGTSTGWSTTSGTWSVVTDGNLVFKQSATGTSGKTNTGTASWTNYTVQARVKANELPSGTASGIVARYTDDNNLYWLRLHAAGNVELYKAVGGTFTLIHSVAQSVVANTWYTLKLALNGSTLSAYVDGIQKFSVTDTTHTTGKIGARSYQQAFSIDDVLVTTP